jgi:large-conductance mechanosensitive channel
MVAMRNDFLVKFVVKKAVVASAITYLIASQVQSLASLTVDTLVEPLFSIDLDKDGNPDLKQLERMVVKCFGLKFPLGKLITQLIKFVVFLLFIYLILTIFMEYTSLIKI